MAPDPGIPGSERRILEFPDLAPWDREFPDLAPWGREIPDPGAQGGNPGSGAGAPRGGRRKPVSLGNPPRVCKMCPAGGYFPREFASRCKIRVFFGFACPPRAPKKCTFLHRFPYAGPLFAYQPSDIWEEGQTGLVRSQTSPGQKGLTAVIKWSIEGLLGPPPNRSFFSPESAQETPILDL